MTSDDGFITEDGQFYTEDDQDGSRPPELNETVAGAKSGKCDSLSSGMGSRGMSSI
jgi:hypothetical protein